MKSMLSVSAKNMNRLNYHHLIGKYWEEIRDDVMEMVSNGENFSKATRIVLDAYVKQKETEKKVSEKERITNELYNLRRITR